MKQCTKCKKPNKNKGVWCYFCTKEYNDMYRLKNKDRIIKQRKIFYENNKERLTEKQRKYSAQNKEKIKTSASVYRLQNKAAILNRNKNYVNGRKAKDSSFKLALNLRSRLGRLCSKINKAGSTVKDLGCSISELKSYLESKFQEGMSWENYGRTGWHVDHIKPLSVFNLENRQQFLEAAHYTNLQPLWAIDNLIKSNKYTEIDEKGNLTDKVVESSYFLSQP